MFSGTEKCKRIECSETDLEKLLDQIVIGTEGFSLSQLLDLYNQFGEIIKKFSKTHIRHPLPNVRNIFNPDNPFIQFYLFMF